MTIAPVAAHATSEVPDPSGIDLAALRWDDPEMWIGLDREAVFAAMRADHPVLWCDEPEIPGFGQGPGFWSLSRYADIMEVSRNPQRFVSGQGTNIPDMPMEIAEFFGSMINMDAPRHTRLRLIVNRAFTPRRVARIDDQVQAKAEAIVAGVAERGECDFVSEIAAKLPLEIICDMMGIPPSEYQRVFELTNIILGAGDAEYTPDFMALMNAAVELSQMAQEIGRHRLDHPADDLTTAMMQAEVEGEDGTVHRLSAEELGSFFILLVAAGNETTRNAISHGMYALTTHPDQRQALAADFETAIPGAVEEIVRWATPVIHFRRTAVEDCVIGGHDVKAGDKVVMWFNSANRDDAVFADPYRFDIARTPNEHVGFGAGGPHFCLGANLARREITVMFRELFRQLPDIEITGEPDYLQSIFIHGIKRMPCAFTPR
ncbi:MAG: cytochrome P450 [Acidimicrobiales bacterium]